MSEREKTRFVTAALLSCLSDVFLSLAVFAGSVSEVGEIRSIPAVGLALFGGIFAVASILHVLFLPERNWQKEGSDGRFER